jgi:hypothetical protein
MLLFLEEIDTCALEIVIFWGTLVVGKLHFFENFRLGLKTF